MDLVFASQIFKTATENTVLELSQVSPNILMFLVFTKKLVYLGSFKI